MMSGKWGKAAGSRSWAWAERHGLGGDRRVAGCIVHEVVVIASLTSELQPRKIEALPLAGQARHRRGSFSLYAFFVFRAHIVHRGAHSLSLTGTPPTALSGAGAVECLTLLKSAVFTHKGLYALRVLRSNTKQSMSYTCRAARDRERALSIDRERSERRQMCRCRCVRCVV